MGYAFEDLDDAQFERIVVQLARKQFGLAAQGFATGPDGGRDARFIGVAAQFPSSNSPWDGTTVFQAKHTNATNVHFSDAAFSGDNDSSVLSEEILRIAKLVEAGELDNYYLVANRRLGAIAHSAIVARISAECGIPIARIFLAGQEYLDEMLHQFPDLLSLARVDPIDGPLLVSSYDLAEVILALSTGLDAKASTPAITPIERTSYEDKNHLNGMTETFAKELQRRYLPLTRQVDEFLADPANGLVTDLYDGAVEELQLKIIAKRDEFPDFDNLFNHLFDTLVDRDGVLSKSRRLTRAMLFYMYWHCDIGKSLNADAD